MTNDSKNMKGTLQKKKNCIKYFVYIQKKMINPKHFEHFVTVKSSQMNHWVSCCMKE